MNKDKKVATKQIAEILTKIDTLLAEAVEIADESGVDFKFEGPSYGMGGRYFSKPENPDDDWKESDSGWMSSSQSC